MKVHGPIPLADAEKTAPATPTGPQRRIYRIPAEMLLEMLQGKRLLPVPEDAQMLRFWPDHEVDTGGVVLCLALEHPTFEPVSWKVPIFELVEKKPNRIEIGPAAKAKSA